MQGYVETGELTGERVLVTGGSGFIGRTVVAGLVAAGAEVSVADLVAHPDERIPQILGDLRDPAVRERAVRPGLTGIVHLAAQTSVLGSLRDPGLVHQVNVDATAGLLELARQREVPRFMMASTNAVAGDVGTETIHEGRPLLPLTPYGATKAAAEMLMSGYAGGYGLTTCALRLTNVYGPGMAHKDSMVPRLMRAARAGTPIEVYGTGTQVRDFVHVRDVFAGLLVAWRSGVVGPLILGSGRSVSVLELISAVEKTVGTPLQVEHIDAKPGEMPAVVVSIRRAQQLGYEPAFSIEDGLATVWAEFR